MKKKVGFIGLGVMGFNMAKNLIKHVDQLNIISRNSKKTLSFISKFKKKTKNCKFLKLWRNLQKIQHYYFMCW